MFLKLVSKMPSFLFSDLVHFVNYFCDCLNILWTAQAREDTEKIDQNTKKAARLHLNANVHTHKSAGILLF